LNYRVKLTKTAQKQADKAPSHVLRSLITWAESVEEYGLPETRRIPGFHDEPLKGKLQGKRSVRLTLQWRAIYEITPAQDIIFVTVERIIPHDYR
jgi:proteic killer suppression protein